MKWVKDSLSLVYIIYAVMLIAFFLVLAIYSSGDFAPNLNLTVGAILFSILYLIFGFGKLNRNNFTHVSLILGFLTVVLYSILILPYAFKFFKASESDLGVGILAVLLIFPFVLSVIIFFIGFFIALYQRSKEQELNSLNNR